MLSPSIYYRRIGYSLTTRASRLFKAEKMTIGLIQDLLNNICDYP